MNTEKSSVECSMHNDSIRTPRKKTFLRNRNLSGLSGKLGKTREAAIGCELDFIVFNDRP